MTEVVIIGGGASGMMAAITAAENKDNHVVLLERQQRVGRKLLATGNGRCNITNTGASAENYHGADPDFVKPALAAFGPRETLDFFEGLGLITVEEYGGRVYPFSNSANSVVDVLRFALENRGADVRTACPVKEIRRSGSGFDVITEGGSLHADRLIVACGGAAGGKVGGVSDGYELLKPLGHKRTKLYPVLMPVFTEPEYPRALKGIRADVQLMLMSGDTVIAASCGELQFTDNGVSGPAVFDISGRLPEARDRAALHIDLTNGRSEQFRRMLRERKTTMAGTDSAEALTGMLHNRLGRMVLKRCGIAGGRTIAELTDRETDRIADMCADFTLKVTGSAGFDSAQVTGGGIKTDTVDPNTMQSRLVPNLYICGELLDVDGDCGGYNLQWAWACGRMAGQLK